MRYLVRSLLMASSLLVGHLGPASAETDEERRAARLRQSVHEARENKLREECCAPNPNSAAYKRKLAEQRVLERKRRRLELLAEQQRLERLRTDRLAPKSETGNAGVKPPSAVGGAPILDGGTAGAPPLGGR